MVTRPRPFLAAALATLVLSSAACGEGAPSDGRIRIVAGLYPLAWIAHQVGGERVSVEDLTPKGGEAHDTTLSAAQRADLQTADVVLLLGRFGFQPDVERAAEQASGVVVDVSTDLRLTPATDGLARDPHAWLDPTRLATIAASVAEVLATVDPGGASAYAEAAARTTADLRVLDDAFSTALASCSFRGFVTTHDAFGYLALRYDLRQVPLEGASPDAEPTAAAIEVALAAMEDGIAAPVIFAEETDAARRVADAVAAGSGSTVSVRMLRTLEADPSPDDYLSVMRANLTVLAEGLGCAR